MNSGNKFIRFLVWCGVVFLQLVMSQVVTFLASLPFPGFGDFPQTHPWLFVAAAGFTFTLGVFLTGWLALKWRWLKGKPRLPARLTSTLLGAYIPLALAALLYHPLEPGNPLFFIAILLSIAGFHLAGRGAK